MAKYSESQKKATAKYNKANYDDIKVRMPKGKRDVYKQIAKDKGVSLNQLILRYLESLE